MSLSSGGRSAVRTISGTPDSSASQTAGWRFAAAVPDVVSTAAGVPLAWAAPSAKNAAERSSRMTRVRTSEARQSASASGLDREPGQIVASRRPQRESSSTNADARAVLRLVRSTRRNRSRGSESMPLQGRLVDLDAQAWPAGEVKETAFDPALRGRDRRREEKGGRESVGDAGVPG